MATCAKCQSWNDDDHQLCISCGQAISKGVVWRKMRQWILGIPCKCGFHRGDWDYDDLPSDSGSIRCAQTLECQVCGLQSSKIEHNVEWRSDGVFWESGVCGHCKQLQAREKRDRLTGGGRW